MLPDRAEPHLRFPSINAGYASVFRPGKLSVGLVSPVEAYSGSPTPTMARHRERIQLAEALGFSAVWVRDVPFHVPSFGDAGQMFEPFTYLGFLAGLTSRIALGTASVVLPLRHPAHVAKAAASVDALSGGRLLLGVASGDRPEEYPAMAVPFGERGARFRDSIAYIQNVLGGRPTQDNTFGRVGEGVALLPKPVSGGVPLLITGGSQQDPEWVAAHGDGWMTYPRDPEIQARVIDQWRARGRAAGQPLRPVMQPLYVDLIEAKNDDTASPQPIHLGFRLSARALQRHLRTLRDRGVNHVALNLRFNQQPIEDTLHRLADALFPEFSSSLDIETSP